jgi:hypothetical protein
MSTATLTAETIAGSRVIVLACRHGELMAAPTVPGATLRETDGAVVATLLRLHYRAERCRCTRKLRRRYGV